MKTPLIQIDAFAEHLFEGNPAAVMPLAQWWPDEMLQSIAAENNLSETAFLVDRLPDGVVAPRPDLPAHHLRWFTPAVEVDLCGHATLATASYLYDDVHPDAEALQFFTRSGWLTVQRGAEGGYTMDFPAEVPAQVQIDPRIERALGVPVQQAFRATDLIYVVEHADQVRRLRPDLSVLSSLDVRGVVVTAVGGVKPFDFVSRWFGALAGVPEDPVTGSAHCQLAPLWAERLGRRDMVARQVSSRGGTVRVELAGDRVRLTGGAVRYLEGIVDLPHPQKD